MEESFSAGNMRKPISPLNICSKTDTSSFIGLKPTYTPLHNANIKLLSCFSVKLKVEKMKRRQQLDKIRNESNNKHGHCFQGTTTALCLEA